MNNKKIKFDKTEKINKAKKFKHSILMLVLILLFALNVTTKVSADFGDFSGSSDYGSSYDSYDSYSSYDSSYSSSSYDYSDSSYYDGDYEEGGLVTLIFWIIIIIIIFMPKKSKSGGALNTSINTSSSSKDRRPMSEYQTLDPNFKESDMREKITNLYIQMQNGWQNKDITSLRPYFTDTYYKSVEKQIETYKKSGKTNYIEKIAVLGVELLGFTSKNGEDIITAKVSTRIIDYTLDDATGKLLSGSKTKEKFMTYEYDLMRPTGTLTDETKEKNTTSCPHCGAPIDINESAECPYCHSVITLSQHDFVISAIRGISQVTK